MNPRWWIREVVSATSVVQEATRAMMGSAAPGDKNSLAIETIGKGSASCRTSQRRVRTRPHRKPPPTPADNPAAPAADANELKPNVAADPNELKPNVDNRSSRAASDAGQ